MTMKCSAVWLKRDAVWWMSRRGKKLKQWRWRCTSNPVQQSDNLKSVNAYSSPNPWFIHTIQTASGEQEMVIVGADCWAASQGRCCLVQIQRWGFYRPSLYARSRCRPLINSHTALPSRTTFTLQMAVWPSGTLTGTLWLLKSSFGSLCVLKGGVD